MVKTLSRTRRKDYENYVLNAIWNRLGNLNIKPVSQQFIRNEGKNGYFIDLYFPQLNIGIECDEVHHQSSK
ncbi:AbaSI family restriction endonuclease [Lactococcus lactis]|uniref:AbaSI family restriction endonuclease n=1 Tax=Lactococcus lactis TaxID=1358 RepID=UPI0038783738